jgi:hypothetical protein
LTVLDPERTWWGFVSRPDAIRFLHRFGQEWRAILGEPGLAEARVFHPGADLHWRDGRGVVIEEGSREQLDAEPPPGTIALGGAGWLARERRSRLWGEYLDGSDFWYEEAIPDPLRYEGVSPGQHHRYVFVRYREYVQRGSVRFVRFLRLEGGRR